MSYRFADAELLAVLAYRADLPEHLFGPDGFGNSGKLVGTRAGG